MSLVSHWALDETSGLVATDSVGGYNGTLTNMTGSEWSPGQQIIGASCLKINSASNNYVYISSMPGVGSGNFSISAWIKTTQDISGGGQFFVVSRGVWSPNQGWILGAEGVGGITYVYLKCEGVSSHSEGIFNNLSDGNWHLMIGVLDATKPYIYIDGVLHEEFSIGNRGGYTEPTREVEFGQMNGFSEKYNGYIDQVKYFNHALSADEIAALYAEGYPSALTSILSSGSNVTFNNNIFLSYHANENIELQAGGGTHKSNAAYNYASDRTIALTGGTWTNSIVNQNPFLQDKQIVRASDEDPAEVIVRRMRLTIASDMMIDSADKHLASQVDILGRSRKVTPIPILTGVVGYWKLDETSGVVAHDAVGVNDLIFDTAPSWVAGVKNNCAQLSTNCVARKANPVGIINPSFSTSCWVNTVHSSSEQWLVDKNDFAGSEKSFTVIILSDERILFLISNTGHFDDGRLWSTSTVPMGTWSHVVCTYNGSSGTMSVYINNILCGTSFTSQVYSGTCPLSLNRNNSINGKLDEVIIFNHELSTTEINDLYTLNYRY